MLKLINSLLFIFGGLYTLNYMSTAVQFEQDQVETIKSCLADAFRYETDPNVRASIQAAYNKLPK